MRSLTVREEIAAICSLLLSIQHEQGALEGERLHDYRVVLRRLSVILPLMIPQPDERYCIGKWLKHELKKSNPIRNQTVLVHHISTRSWLASCVGAGHGDAIYYSDLSGLRRLYALLHGWQQPVYGLIAHHHLLWLQQNALIRLQQRLVRLNQLDDTKGLNAALHRLRIAVKKVRYLCQWLELISGQPAAMLTPLTAWQQRLGALSDLQLVRRWLVDRGSTEQMRRLDGEISAQQQGIMAGLGELHLLLKGALALSVAAQNSGYFFHQLDSQ